MDQNLKYRVFLYVDEFFTPTSIEKFLAKSTYKLRKTWVQDIKGCICKYISDYNCDLTKPQKLALHELSMIVLQECRSLPEVSGNELVDKYMHIVEHLNDGSLVHERQKLQNLADKLERKILHTISQDDPVLVKAFLRVICLFGNKKMLYDVEDCRALLNLLGQ